jgi:hypothetical protein
LKNVILTVLKLCVEFYENLQIDLIWIGTILKTIKEIEIRKREKKQNKKNKKRAGVSFWPSPACGLRPTYLNPEPVPSLLPSPAVRPSSSSHQSRGDQVHVVNASPTKSPVI